jgi:hypothetical protein
MAHGDAAMFTAPVAGALLIEDRTSTANSGRGPGASFAARSEGLCLGGSLAELAGDTVASASFVGLCDASLSPSGR